jgi:hypothetical protein
VMRSRGGGFIFSIKPKLLPSDRRHWPRLQPVA